MKKLAPLFLLLPILVAGCHHGMRTEIRGNGKRELQKRQVGPFTSISTNGAFTVEVTCQKDLSLEIEGDENVLPLITTEVGNNILKLDSSQNYSVSDPIRIRISVPNLEGLSVNGAGHFDIKGMNNDKFEIDSNGAPAISVAGTTKIVDIDANGAGKVDTQNLHAARAVVDARGVAKVDLDVSDQLDVQISGPSSVTYSGNPTVNKTINGPGKLIRKGGEGA
ncbi:MAG TPA: head GIN domain-containing protein [Pyrinomonadaceae bacterium]|nr:head GIN domain-containing protein [Pyrinomonadaceae bacterium]